MSSEFDPYPMVEGEVIEMPCGRCGDPVLTKLVIGDGESVAQMWANDQIEFLCGGCWESR